MFVRERVSEDKLSPPSWQLPGLFTGGLGLLVLTISVNMRSQTTEMIFVLPLLIFDFYVVAMETRDFQKNRVDRDSSLLWTQSKENSIRKEKRGDQNAVPIQTMMIWHEHTQWRDIRCSVMRRIQRAETLRCPLARGEIHMTFSSLRRGHYLRFMKPSEHKFAFHVFEKENGIIPKDCKQTSLGIAVLNLSRDANKMPTLIQTFHNTPFAIPASYHTMSSPTMWSSEVCGRLEFSFPRSRLSVILARVIRGGQGTRNSQSFTRKYFRWLLCLHWTWWYLMNECVSEWEKS